MPTDGTQALSGVSPATAKSLQSKIQTLTRPAPGPLTPVIVTEDEANAFLRLHGQKLLPSSIRDPEVHISPQGISGAADVNFSQLGQLKAGSSDWQTRALSAVFRGEQHVSALGKLETTHGQGRIVLQSAAIGNTPLPPVLVDWLIENYIRPRYNFDLTMPIRLPDHVTRVELKSGRAVLFRVQ
jgi:hypothetical protein